MSSAAARSEDRQFWVAVFRGLGGALLFSMPILMTMETWWLGFYIARVRLALYLVLSLPLVLLLSYFAGLREDLDLREVVLDGFTAYAIGIVASVVVLGVLGIITVQMPSREIIGKIAMQAPTATVGAILARSQLGASGENTQEQKKEHAGYHGELFLVAAGAFYLASTVASTEEMILIPFKMTPWHGLAVILLSLLMMHAFLYTMKFEGAPQEPEGTPGWSIFLRYTVPGYAVVLLVCGYVLWTFGRFESSSLYWMAMYTVVLGLPGAVGGAAGRLIV